MTYDQWKTAYPPEYDELQIPVDELEKELKSYDGRNPDCFPICSFGWKDADLEHTGCTGIKRLSFPDEDTIIVEIGGHKTVVGVNQDNVWNMPDHRVDEFMDECYEIVCDCFPRPGSDGEWTGDDWSMSFKDEIEVKWEYTGEPNDIGDDIEYDIKKTARKIFDKSSKHVEKTCELTWIQIDRYINEVYQRAIEEFGE